MLLVFIHVFPFPQIRTVLSSRNSTVTTNCTNLLPGDEIYNGASDDKGLMEELDLRMFCAEAEKNGTIDEHNLVNAHTQTHA